MDRSFALYDATLNVLTWIWLGVLLNDIRSFNNQTIF
ncbi:uncharacterized protein METZ01_LOCUS27550 [marine metagenome]|uniref:Uncharacterized protein n=1 Tax=marine metagenome TaxID=408172 RepID=A0A381Q5R1_9ZZZZ